MAKATHASCHYRDGTPQRHCGNCEYHEGADPMHCSKVVDPISATGRCDWWKKEKPKNLSSQLVALELSKKTPALVATPAPYGKPGGTGLYGVKGNKHSNYFEHVVQALLRHGMSKAKASRIAWAALRKWSAGKTSGGEKGHIHPEVRAAAANALRGEASAEARAKRRHSHSNLTAQVVDLAPGMWRGLGKGKGWAYVGPRAAQAQGNAAPKAAAQPTPATQKPAAKGAANVAGLTKQLGQVNLAIKAAQTAVTADELAKQQAVASLNSYQRFIAGGFTSTGGSTASGSSTASTTTAGGTTTTTNAQGTTTSTNAQGRTTTTMQSLQNAVNVASAKLTADQNRLNGLLNQRTSLVAQIKKLGG